MGANTKIEWAHHTFNPWIGCTKVSAGCTNCYAERDQDHFRGRVKWGKGNPRSLTSDANWKLPERWNRQAATEGTRYRVFCASLADVFDEEVPDAWRVRLFALIWETPHLDWLLLTKRPHIALEFLTKYLDRFTSNGRYPIHNLWLGTSVEDQPATSRIDQLLKLRPFARILFLSCEPLIAELYLALHNWANPTPNDCCDAIRNGTHTTRIDWVIVGGESGPNARPMHPNWVRLIRDDCAAAHVPFLFKQWGEYVPSGDIAPTQWAGRELYYFDKGQSMLRVGKHAAGNHLDGRQHLEFPR